MTNLSNPHALDIGKRWTAAWSQDDPTVWTNIYTEDATYTDYAFGFVRRGKRGLHEHFNIWRAAHPDFQVFVVEAWPGIELDKSTLSGHLSSVKTPLVKYSIRTKNIGTFTNDLPSLKASGKKFDFYAVVDIVVRADDEKIVQIDEWYHKQFGEYVTREQRRVQS